MGRTIHFELKPKNGCFAEEELEKIYEMSLVVNNSCKWTCENFVINPYEIYPNWSKKSTWDKVNQRYEYLKREGFSVLEICKALVKEGIALHHFGDEDPHYKVYGFTKVGGNELNAAVVVVGLAAISSVVKNASIAVHDEGRFLKCQIVIEEGKARPDYKAVKEDIGWKLSTQWREGYKDLYPKLKKEARVLHDLIEHYCSKYHPPRCEWPLKDFCRPINPQDFEGHPEYGIAQIMAGFGGEYYGLTDKDPEAESYRACAFIKKLLPSDCKMEIAPRIGNTERKSAGEAKKEDVSKSKEESHEKE